MLFADEFYLSQSYRITKEMADFINICLFNNSDRIKSENVTNNKTN